MGGRMKGNAMGYFIGGFFVSMIVFLLGSVLFYKQEKKIKPRVHVWTHNHMTMVVAEPDFEAAILFTQRNNLAWKDDSTMLYPSIYCLFSDKKDHPIIYSMTQYNQLIAGCTVVSSKMSVPSKPAYRLDEMYRLVYGPDAVLPSEPDSDPDPDPGAVAKLPKAA
jgi:hypothetical protein